MLSFSYSAKIQLFSYSSVILLQISYSAMCYILAIRRHTFLPTKVARTLVDVSLQKKHYNNYAATKHTYEHWLDTTFVKIERKSLCAFAQCVFIEASYSRLMYFYLHLDFDVSSNLQYH